MSTVLKYKVKEFSKDVCQQPNDVMDIMEKYGKRPQTNTTNITDEELDYLLSYYIKNNAGKNVDEYMAMLDSPKKSAPKPEAKKEEVKPEAKKPETKKTEAKPEAKKPAANKPEAKKADVKPQDKKPANKPQDKPKTENKNNQPKANNNQQKSNNAAPFAPKKKGERQEHVAPEKRIVDTKGVSVDLSKYDQKLEELAPEKAKDLGRQFQKIKKQGGKFQKGKKETEAEKIKRLEAERAKRPQISVVLPEEIAVCDLAAKLHATNAEVVKRLMTLGVMASANQVIEYDAAALVAEEFGAKVTKEVVVTIEEQLIDESEDTDDNLIPRNPVVVVMGHVDHGKTSLLDAIRHSNVASGEAGGITQAIGAYKVRINDQDITFLDTPGHEAFTAMRMRGAQVTDVAILVVAADDGIMPQTIEAIHHAKAAGVEIVVAINKMDKHGANPDRIKQQLTEYELIPEEWGGETICVPVSAIKKEGIDKLLESVLLVAEMKELKANPNRAAKGTVIEARLDKGRGPVTTVLVQNGTLHLGDTIIAGTAVGRIRAMIDDKGKNVKFAGPSDPVEIIGLSEVPDAGDIFHAVEDERMARELVEERKFREKEEQFKASNAVSLEDLFSRIQEGAVKDFNVVVKADVKGSAEAVKQSLEKISNEEVQVKVIHMGVGAINESDIMLAAASNAIVVGFNVRPDSAAKDSAARNSIQIKTYRVIYDCIEEIEAALKGMLAPKIEEKVIGHAEIRQVYKVSGVGSIAGCYVTDGKIQRNCQVRLLRDNIVIFEGNLASLKRFKDDAKEVSEGFECGMSIEKYNDIKELDVIEAFVMDEIKAE